MIQIGYTMKTHGVAGEIKVAIEPGYEDIFLEKDRIFLDLKGQKIPYFIQSIRGEAAFIVKFEDIKNKEDAAGLQSKGIFLPEAEVADAEPIVETTPYGHLVGYLLRDKTVGDIGTIEDVIDLPQHELAAVTYKGKEVLAPLHKHFILNINEKQKTVLADFPDGLFEL
jgi:16S rRNA processing protein RimM